MKIVDDEILELRSKYRREAHNLWTQNIHDEERWKAVYQIKQNILKKEIANTEEEFPDKVKFYSYRSFADWNYSRLESEMSDIKNCIVTLVKPSLFNDPYDCRVPKFFMENFLKKFGNSSQKHRLQKLARESVKSVTPNAPRWYRKQREKSLIYNQKILINDSDYVQERIDGLRDTMFVKSLSTEVNSMYFWSHYSYSHKGYCIEYEVDKSSFNKYFHPIEYSYGWPNDFLEFLNRSGANCAFSLVKSLDWKNEMEWRLIDALGKNDTRKDINFVKSDLKNGFSVSAIYLGLDFEKNEDSRKEKLINALQETDIKIFQMNIGDDDFKIGVGKQIK